MAIDKRLLEILCCPVTKTPVTVLGSKKLELINAAIAAEKALYVNGDAVESPLKDALITTDNKVIYRIDDDIPVMLEEKGIGTTQFDFF